MNHVYVHKGVLIDGNGGPPLRDAAVLIEGDRITAAGPAARVKRPDGPVRELDAGGGAILPGLIDAHVHVMFEGLNILRMLATPFSLNFYQAIPRLRRTLDAGITSVRDAGGADLGVKHAVEQGLVAGPRMQVSVSVLGTTGGHVDFWMRSGVDLKLFVPHPGRPDGTCDGVEEVRKKVREVLRAGAEVIKVRSKGGVGSTTDHPRYTQFTEAELAVMVQEGAYRDGVKVMAHAQGVEGVKNAVRAGIHSIEHGIYLDDEAIELMLERGTYLVPTLLAPVAVLEDAETHGNVPPWAVDKARETIDAHRDSVAKAHKAGVKIAMGTDAGVMAHGTNLRELGLMCDAGLSPMEALVATTKTAAECLGWADQLGTLEPGKLADLIVVQGDPLKNVRALEDPDAIQLVLQGGQVVKDLRGG